MDFNNKKVCVIGMGVSNTPLVEWLLAHGAIVTARDKKGYDELNDKAKELVDSGVKLISGENYLCDIEDDYIFRTPGLRYDAPELVAAVEKGSVLTSEMELFFELCPAHIVAVTGSDGKTTTTTLISKILEAAGKVYVGGNIGAPLLPFVEEMTKDDWAVLELSSFQLHTMKRSPDIAVVTNLSPNHLDYHRGMEEYVEAKKNIFLHQKPGSKLVLNMNNDITRSFEAEAADGCEVLFFADESGVCERDGAIWYKGEKVIDVDDILLPGHHNVENYMAAIAATYPIVGAEPIRELARTFGGVEHRLEFVREKDGVRFYNSSIDSSPTRTTAALSAFKEKVIVILGGYDKQIPFEPLAKPLCEHCKTAVLCGATAKKIRDAVENSPEYKEAPFEMIDADNFEDAVLKAASMAVAGDNVVLSPACASFDAFPNFMVRGNRFKEIVRSL
ncbi:MAG: UDP-N-acetylmuramoyl-L-alanine--D-glutamate ligase [Clostridia bacterium]|nr:UDP-N-acetylmuramoyl-L-alanine--D-glutamate ligase [Clostridia bacterium]